MQEAIHGIYAKINMIKLGGNLTWPDQTAHTCLYQTTLIAKFFLDLLMFIIELKRRRGDRDNSEIMFLIFNENIRCDP